MVSLTSLASSFRDNMGRYRVKSKNSPGLAKLASSFPPKDCSKSESNRLAELPASIQGGMMAKAWGSVNSGMGSVSSKAPILTKQFYQLGNVSTNSLSLEIGLWGVSVENMTDTRSPPYIWIKYPQAQNDAGISTIPFPARLTSVPMFVVHLKKITLS